MFRSSRLGIGQRITTGYTGSVKQLSQPIKASFTSATCAKKDLPKPLPSRPQSCKVGVLSAAPIPYLQIRSFRNLSLISVESGSSLVTQKRFQSTDNSTPKSKFYKDRSFLLDIFAQILASTVFALLALLFQLICAIKDAYNNGRDIERVKESIEQSQSLNELNKALLSKVFIELDEKAKGSLGELVKLNTARVVQNDLNFCKSLEDLEKLMKTPDYRTLNTKELIKIIEEKAKELAEGLFKKILFLAKKHVDECKYDDFIKKIVEFRRQVENLRKKEKCFLDSLKYVLPQLAQTIQDIKWEEFLELVTQTTIILMEKFDKAPEMIGKSREDIGKIIIQRFSGDKQKGNGIYIHARGGWGKTTLVKDMLKQLFNMGQHDVIIWVNCYDRITDREFASVEGVGNAFDVFKRHLQEKGIIDKECRVREGAKDILSRMPIGPEKTKIEKLIALHTTSEEDAFKKEIVRWAESWNTLNGIPEDQKWTHAKNTFANITRCRKVLFVVDNVDSSFALEVAKGFRDSVSQSADFLVTGRIFSKHKEDQGFDRVGILALEPHEAEALFKREAGEDKEFGDVFRRYTNGIPIRIIAVAKALKCLGERPLLDGIKKCFYSTVKAFMPEDIHYQKNLESIMETDWAQIEYPHITHMYAHNEFLEQRVSFLSRDEIKKISERFPEKCRDVFGIQIRDLPRTPSSDDATCENTHKFLEGIPRLVEYEKGISSKLCGGSNEFDRDMAQFIRERFGEFIGALDRNGYETSDYKEEKKRIQRSVSWTNGNKPQSDIDYIEYREIKNFQKAKLDEWKKQVFEHENMSFWSWIWSGCPSAPSKPDNLSIPLSEKLFFWRDLIRDTKESKK